MSTRKTVAVSGTNVQPHWLWHHKRGVFETRDLVLFGRIRFIYGITFKPLARKYRKPRGDYMVNLNPEHPERVIFHQVV